MREILEPITAETGETLWPIEVFGLGVRYLRSVDAEFYIKNRRDIVQRIRDDWELDSDLNDPIGSLMS